MSVVVVGISHTKAPLEVLEQVVVPEAATSKALASLIDSPNVNEVVLLSTCLRTEVYAVVDRFHEAVSEIQEALSRETHVPLSTLSSSATVRFDDEVAVHLFSVSAGLESLVLGEGEVIGQVRRAFERASGERAAGPVLDELFRHALRAGKRVRSETAIARGTTSFAHAAVELANDRRAGGLDSCSVGVLGAGEMGVGVARTLCNLPGDLDVVVFNRTTERAVSALEALGLSQRVRVEPLDALPRLAGGLDALFCTLEVEGACLSVADLVPRGDRRDRPILVVDLGVPRNVDPVVRAHPGVVLYDMDDLSSVVEQAKGQRRAELDDARRIVLDEVASYRQATRARGAAPVIAALRKRIEDLRSSEIAKLSSELDDTVLAQIDEATRGVLNKVLHDPTMVLRESAGTSKGERLVEALRLLFSL